MLLSGGLDSSIAALLTAGLWTKAYCVTLPGAPDDPYARAVADHLGLNLQRIETSVEELDEAIPTVTDELNSFDPMRVRNAVVPYLGLRQAREDGVETLATGDGADELFAGYRYMREMAPGELDAYRQEMADEMSFSTPRLASALGLEARSPFLDSSVERHALQLPAEALVTEHAESRWGKRILREAFADELPDPVRWQRKDPIEKGSGSWALAEHYAEAFDEDELQGAVEEARREGVRLRDAEHAAYYRAYRETNPPPGEAHPTTAVQCEGCRAPLDAPYCRVCGHTNDPDR